MMILQWPFDVTDNSQRTMCVILLPVTAEKTCKEATVTCEENTELLVRTDVEYTRLCRNERCSIAVSC